MYKKTLYFSIIALLLLCNIADCKKSKKYKTKPNIEEDFSTLQPNVISYSTFGFNDVGSHDGFIPTSPDHASFLSGAGQESTTRLYAPAFPSAMESTGFNGNLDASQFAEHLSGPGEDTIGASGMLHYQPSSVNFFNAPDFAAVENHNNNFRSEGGYVDNKDESNAPVYGTKINGRNKSKSPSLFNSTEFDIFSKNFSIPTNNKIFNYQDVEPAPDNRPPYSEPSVNYQNQLINTNNYVPTYVSQDELEKSIPNHMHSALNFPKVVEFTKYYPTELDTSKYPDYMKFANTHNIIPISSGENSLTVNMNKQKFMHSKPTNNFAENIDFKNNEEADVSNPVIQTNPNVEQGYKYNHISQNLQNSPNTKSNSDLKKKPKHKTWFVGNNNNDLKNLKDSHSLNEYGYSNNFNNMHVKYGTSEIKEPIESNHDEIVPASSNLVDLTQYQQPETDYTTFKKMPEFNDEEEYPLFSPYKENARPINYFYQFKHPPSTETPTTSSYWGNAFKATEYSLFKDHAEKSLYTEKNIPKRLNMPKPSEYKQNEWPSGNRRPHKSKPLRDWTKDYLDTRYKSEEDLLDLRNHDTSHPSYIPTYKTSSDAAESEKEYRKLVEKWRQSYLESKQKDSSLRDYDSYGTEIKPLRVPLPKPYPIEVPYPVIVPVPRPYPVRVPVSRPVAVPVVRELTVPIEKPVPYPVIKKVPYPVEKLVPVPVEKEVAVPVEKPYPVHVPYIRPVFHHTRPMYDDSEDHPVNDEDDYLRRPELKKAQQYRKRPYSSRNRPQKRPSRTVYQERVKRRWPERRRPSDQTYEYTRVAKHSTHYNFNDNEPETEEEERVNYAHCRRIGKC